jgi:hypothetical protein
MSQFRCYVRIVSADPLLIEEYAAAGVEDVVVWADQVWQGDDEATKRAALERFAAKVN